MGIKIKKFKEFENHSFVPASGVAVSGWDSSSSFSENSADSSTGTAYATQGNTGGMGNVVSSQPSPVAGDVAGSSKGSGDIGSNQINPYSQYPANFYGNKKKKKKKKVKNKFDDLYVVRFSEYDGVKNIKENKYFPPKKIKCKECGMEVENDIQSMLGHVRNKHWARPNRIMKDYDARVMVKMFFDFEDKTKKEKKKK